MAHHYRDKDGNVITQVQAFTPKPEDVAHAIGAILQRLERENIINRNLALVIANNGATEHWDKLPVNTKSLFDK